MSERFFSKENIVKAEKFIDATTFLVGGFIVAAGVPATAAFAAGSAAVYSGMQFFLFDRFVDD